MGPSAPGASTVESASQKLLSPRFPNFGHPPRALRVALFFKKKKASPGAALFDMKQTNYTEGLKHNVVVRERRRHPLPKHQYKQSKSTMGIQYNTRQCGFTRRHRHPQCKCAASHGSCPHCGLFAFSGRWRCVLRATPYP